MAWLPRSQRIGDLLVARGALRPDDIPRVLTYQTAHPVRFGEAALALGLTTPQAVHAALAHQFGHAVTTPERRQRSPELTLLHQPHSLHAESIRATRAQLLLRMSTGPHDVSTHSRTLAVVSAESGAGRTRLVANLAVSLAQLGRRTLIIDADLHRPRQHEVFDVSPSHGGLAALLADPSAAETIQAIEDIVPLFVLPGGPVPRHPLELLESPGFTALLAELSPQFDHIVVDTPAYAVGSDVLAICARCDASLLVVRPQHTRTRQAQALVEALRHSGTLMLGTVIHDF